MRIISTISNQPSKSHKQSQFQGSGAAIGGAIASSHYFRKKREQELQAQQAQLQNALGQAAQYPYAFYPQLPIYNHYFNQIRLIKEASSTLEALIG